MDFSTPEFLIHGVSLSLGTLGRPCSRKNIGTGIHGVYLIPPGFHPGRLCSLFPGKQLGKGWDPTSLGAGTPPERAGIGAGKEFPAGIQGSFWDRICCADVEDPGSGIWDHSHPSSPGDSPPCTSRMFPSFPEIPRPAFPAFRRIGSRIALPGSCSCSGSNSRWDPRDQTLREIWDEASPPRFPPGCGYLGYPWIPGAGIVRTGVGMFCSAPSLELSLFSRKTLEQMDL